MYFNAAEFGKRVQESRKAQKLTQEQLADILGIDRAHLGRIEIGAKACSIDLLVELSEALHVSVDYLLKGKQKKSDKQKEELLAAIKNLETLAALL